MGVGLVDVVGLLVGLGLGVLALVWAVLSLSQDTAVGFLLPFRFQHAVSPSPTVCLLPLNIRCLPTGHLVIEDSNTLGNPLFFKVVQVYLTFMFQF
jgi:hypothetical protein